MLKQRLLTVLILLPILLLAIFYLPRSLFITINALVLILAAWEWAALSGMGSSFARFLYSIGLGLLLLASYYMSLLPILWLIFLFWVWAFFAIINYARDRMPCGLQWRIPRGIFGFVVLMSTWNAMTYLRDSPMGPFALVYVLMLVWAMDTGGYIVGRLCGKHALISRVSPNKTWEGLMGGLVLACLVAVIVGLFRHLSVIELATAIGIAIVTALFAVIGDLLESMLKRIENIKDSGNILPGHGGILDRFDSVLAAVPVYALMSLWW